MRTEYSASEFRTILQELFPRRRLVLSQFTFFNNSGIAKPTGTTYRRGRQCYREEDILPIACVLALKEEGIPLKNIDTVPALIQDNATEIYHSTSGWRLAGFGSVVSLLCPGDNDSLALETFLADPTETRLFWSFDVSLLSGQVRSVITGVESKLRRRAA